MQLWCGIDWAERHHDVAIIDEAGTVRARARIGDGAAGFTELLALLAAHGCDRQAPIPVAIETAKGLLVAGLRAAGVPVFAINPLSVSRYRDRHSPSRAKSDKADALVLANILRTDAAAHRPVPDDSELAASIRVLARAHQDAIWDRMQTAAKLRSLLREYYPAFLATFEDLTSREASASLRLAPAPAEVADLRKTSLAAGLRRAGRRRGVEDTTTRIMAGLKTEQLRQPPLVEAALATQALAFVRMLDTVVDNLATLEAALDTAYHQHPDAAIIGSFPGLGRSTTTGPDSPTPAASRPSPAPHRSPGPAARRPSSPCARSATSASGKPPTSGRSPCWPTRREPAPTTTGAAGPGTATAPPPATSPTEASACSTTACRPASPTTRPKPSRPRRRPLANPRPPMPIKRARRPQPRPSLDPHRTCDVS
jgi:transposase